MMKGEKKSKEKKEEERDPKFQTPIPKQSPNSSDHNCLKNYLVFGIGCFGDGLVFGVWYLELTQTGYRPNLFLNSSLIMGTIVNRSPTIP